MTRGLNGKVECIYEYNGEIMKLGKVYEFINGYFKRENGAKSWFYESVDSFNCQRYTQIKPYIPEPSVKIIIKGVEIEINEKFNIRYENGRLSHYSPHYFNNNMNLIDRKGNNLSNCIDIIDKLVKGDCTIEKIPQDSQEKLDMLKAIKEMEEKLQEMKQNAEKM